MRQFMFVYLSFMYKGRDIIVLFTYYGACVLILDVDLPEQPALIVLIHDA